MAEQEAACAELAGRLAQGEVDLRRAKELGRSAQAEAVAEQQRKASALVAEEERQTRVQAQVEDDKQRVAAREKKLRVQVRGQATQ